VVPRKLDVATYGEYRLFLVYAGYLGLLHVGLADGAFVRWAGCAPGLIRREAPAVARWLLAIQGSALAVAAFVALGLPSSLARTYLLAFAACALCVNGATLTGYALQASGDFSGAGRVAAMGPALFFTFVLAAPAHSLNALLAGYVAAFAVAALVGAARIARLPAPASREAPPDRDHLGFRRLVRVGLPVLGANLAAGISASADRILVSAVVPFQRFAIYGFATSAMVVATAATQVLSRVSLSHAAHQPPESRAHFLDRFYDIIALGFGAGLAVLPLFDQVVARSLPAYVDALPIVRAVVVGSLFWVAVHVVVVGTLQSYGLVRRQFTLELGGAALVAMACGAALAWRAPLGAIAAAAAAAAAVTWMTGVGLVRRWIRETRVGPSIRFLAVAAAQFAALVIAQAVAGAWTRQTLLYAALAALPTFVAARSAVHRWSA
jgi:O-antigen/teichoic acid export membrane protein